ncbi:hypothetical protein ACJMK2_022523, partial [Sinanodonta woodiana]
KEVTWIQKNIKMRCPYMTSDDQVKKEICQCGYKKCDHELIAFHPQKRAIESPLTELGSDLSKLVYSVPTNAFGEIKFVSCGGIIGKFVRVDRQTDMSIIMELMINVWGIEKPNLLISVTGGAKNFNMKPRLRDAFRYGLMKAVHSTGAWIITGGTHNGVMKHVGESVKEHGLTSTKSHKPIVTIGIAPWGVVQNRNILENKKGSWPAGYSIEEPQKKGESFLDPNHSHFILVDNGSQHKFGTEISFRAALERKISEMQTDTVADTVSVPIVILVLEGGHGTLKTVKTALEENTPAVIVKGSGRAADILAYAFKYAETVEVDAKDNSGVDIKIIKKQMKQHLKDDIAKQMEDMNFCAEKMIPFNVEQIQHCLDKSELIQIFEWNSSSIAQDIDEAILKALLKAKQNQVMDQLKLTLAWNRIDIAKMSEIFTDDKRWTTSSLNNIMLTAIQLNRVNFVELFLDNGVNLKEVLTIRTLCWLYRNVPARSFLKILFTKLWKKKKKQSMKKITLKDVGLLMQDLLGDYYCPHYISDERYATIMEEDLDEDNNGQYSIWVEKRLLDVAQFYDGYSISFKLGGLAAALVANALFHAMTQRTDNKEMIAHINENASEFMTLAIGVLNKCHSTDENTAHDLLTQKLFQWGGTSCVIIAVEEGNKEFISEPACQDLFDNIWMGKMTKENSTWKLSTMQDKTALLCCLSDSYLKRKVKLPNIVKKFSSFYFAPVIIFFHNVISYMLFLGLYSFVLISQLDTNLSVEEIILIVWVVAIFIQEIRQVFTTASVTMKTKFQSYITDGWNVLDIVTILLFVIGMVLRGIKNPLTLEAARVVLGINLLTFFMRLLHIFSVHKDLGPKLVMIISMVYNLTIFAVILLVFVVAYAVVSHAILYPNTEFSLHTMIAIFRRPYWNIYGELMLEEVEGTSDCTSVAELYRNGTYPRCPTVSGKYFVPLLMGLYMFMCNILLLNLLIAIFGYTFQMVQEHTEMHWSFQRFGLINEYYIRPFLAPPLILLAHVYHLIVFFRKHHRLCCNSDSSNSGKSAFLKCVSKEREQELCWFEDVMANRFHHKRKITNQESINYRLDQLVNKINELQQQQQAGEDAQPSHSQTGSPSEQKCMQQAVIESNSDHHLSAEIEEKKQEEYKADEVQTVVYHILEGQVKVHNRSRTSPYPETDLVRFSVPDDKVPWDVDFPEYNPPMYTSPLVLAKSDWADKVDLFSVPVAERKLQFNTFDSARNTKRYSYFGNYRVQNGIPLNPIGRTGLQSRGILGKWGPNHYVDPVITRWKYDENNLKMMKDGKPQFEFVAIRRSDKDPWTLPESILTPGHPPTEHLKFKFSDEALGLLHEDRIQMKKLKQEMKKILEKGKLIYKGYADDPRNTDNAWLESTVYHYRDKKNILRLFSIKATDSGFQATWVIASSELPLYGAHGYFLNLVAEKLYASF